MISGFMHLDTPVCTYVCLHICFMYIYIYMYMQFIRFVICQRHSWRPQAGEKTFWWALENQSDKTYIHLPKWMSSVVELRVSRFVNEHQKWQDVIAKRDLKGKALTQYQQEKYKIFKADLSQKLVFNQKTKKFVGDAATLKKNAKQCISFTLCLSDDPSLLQIVSGKGETFRLAMLQLEGDCQDILPDVLNHPAKVGDIEETEDRERGEQAVGEDDETRDGHEREPFQMSEAHARCLDDDRQKMAADEIQDGSDGEEIELLADSDEEAADFGLPTRVVKVKNFCNRAAWIALGDLTELPRHVTGCSIAYHSTSQQWQGHYRGSREPMSASWGGSSKRSEKEAILKAVKGILRAHVHANPKDKAWGKQLEKVEAAEISL